MAGLEYSLPYILNIGVINIQEHTQPLISRLKEEQMARIRTARPT